MSTTHLHPKNSFAPAIPVGAPAFRGLICGLDCTAPSVLESSPKDRKS